jgi:hypothetical protein
MLDLIPEERIVGEPIVIREWNADEFHRRVLGLEKRGYIARSESYQIVPEMNSETGEIIHLWTIELSEPDARSRLKLLGRRIVRHDQRRPCI